MRLAREIREAPSDYRKHNTSTRAAVGELFKERSSRGNKNGGEKEEEFCSRESSIMKDYSFRE